MPLLVNMHLKPPASAVKKDTQGHMLTVSTLFFYDNVDYNIH